MSELSPLPFDRLVRRLAREVEAGEGIFDLPRRAFFLGDPKKDFSVKFHGRDVSTPLGPAAGPHTQLAQNIVLSWLGGARVFELKTVQILDRLKIPRPCIDMRNVGYNVEWSQELTLEQSLEEYVKASMLIDMLRSAGLAQGYDSSIFDMSVGYDLAGIQTPRVRAFIDGMKDAQHIVNRLARQIPIDLQRWRDVKFSTRISDTVTLSTFHGCPPKEIEGIAQFMMAELGLNVIVKLNPTLLGPSELRGLLHDQLGYKDVRVPDEAFEKDARWEDVTGFVERLARKAESRRLGFGVKFCNTLVVENTAGYLPASEKTSYLSGAPLHVLAMHLVKRFRTRYGTAIPISYSGGIDRKNFPDAVGLGLVPVTICSDLLKPGGFGRLSGCMEELSKRMDEACVSNIKDFVRKSPDVDAYVAAATKDPRYALAKNTSVPRKVGSELSLFDCLTCDKCVSVCPNDANFAYDSVGAPSSGRVHRENGGWRLVPTEAPPLEKKRQFANFADFCNMCGNCDVFCPENGGPFLRKPRFFGSLKALEESELDGFFVAQDKGGQTVHGRIAGRMYALRIAGDHAQCSGDGLSLGFNGPGLAGTAQGDAKEGWDMSPYLLMDFLRKAVLSSSKVNYVNT
jgi:putative selenate reductase